MNTMRLRGYSILVSNETVLPLPESSCYTDPGNVKLPTIIENNCGNKEIRLDLPEQHPPL